jgi:hypothetical protein
LPLYEECGNFVHLNDGVGILPGEAKAVIFEFPGYINGSKMVELVSPPIDKIALISGLLLFTIWAKVHS